MRVTTEIRNYIRAEIYAKAKPRLDELNEKRDNIIKKYMDRYDKFVMEAEAETDALNKKLAATAELFGLTVRDKERDFVSCSCIQTCYFKEVYTSYHCNSYKYEYNHDIDAIDEMLNKLKKDIEHQISGVVFKLEAGAKRDEIFAMLAEIHF